MATSKLKDCPTRPDCLVCGMAMVTLQRIKHQGDIENCRFECLRCGHIEVSEPA
jgi:transcription elongation factor Elf1